MDKPTTENILYNDDDLKALNALKKQGCKLTFSDGVICIKAEKDKLITSFGIMRHRYHQQYIVARNIVIKVEPFNDIYL